MVDQPRVTVGCDVCLQVNSRVQLNCTATPAESNSDKTLQYKWLFTNTGVSTGVTSPLYTVSGMGKFSCNVTNAGLTTTRTSNVYCKFLGRCIVVLVCLLATSKLI